MRIQANKGKMYDIKKYDFNKEYFISTADDNFNFEDIEAFVFMPDEFKKLKKFCPPKQKKDMEA